jgi:hypothetical protein
MTRPRTRIAKTGVGRRRASPALWKRKNLVIDQHKLDRAKAILRLPTETAAVDAALDLVAFRGEVLESIDRLAAAGGLAKVFDRD